MSVLLRGLFQSTGLGIPQIVGQSGVASSLREVKHERPVQIGGMKPTERRSWREGHLREDSSTLHVVIQRGQKRSMQTLEP